MGARHLPLRDGLWLQPEPLGITNGSLNLPRGYSGLYAAGNSNLRHDRAGTFPPLLVAAAVFIVKEVATELATQAAVRGADAVAPGSGMVVEAAAMFTSPTQLLKGAGKKVMREAASRAVTRAAKETAEGATTKAVKEAGCFLDGTEVVTFEHRPIEGIEVGERVVAAASTDGGEEPWVEVEDVPVEERGAWGPRGVCDRVTAWAPKWAMPAMVALAACGAEPEIPAADEVVQVYDARTGDWSEAVRAELEVGDTWLDDGRLHRWTDAAVEDRGAAAFEDLAEADATWTAEAATRVPSTDDWVLVLGDADEAGAAPGVSPGGAGTAASDSSRESGHWKLGAVEAGERFAFQGRVFDTADADGDGLIEVRPTGDVLGRVVNTFVRMAPEVIDADIEYADGSTDTLTGTPNHPFWVPAVRDYVPLGELKVGTVLHVQGGGEAILVSKTWRQGDFEVFDFEVAGLHNFYVRGPGGDAAGVLVHNSDGGNVVYRALRAGEDPAVGLSAKVPGAGTDVGSHVMGNQTTDLISATKDPELARGLFNSGNGVVAIDLNKVSSEVIDASQGVGSGRVYSRTKSHQEVLIRDAGTGGPAVPPEAITPINPNPAQGNLFE